MFCIWNSNISHLLFDLFIRSEEDDMDTSWEQRLVKRYYDKLFKEYPLLYYRSIMYAVGLRWRTEKEVISGKGTFDTLVISLLVLSNEKMIPTHCGGIVRVTGVVATWLSTLKERIETYIKMNIMSRTLRRKISLH
ncbi:putative folate-sensitive fragile site protein Fra10Ac1 [Helianthus annuus]|nr:putative folate-sensitive fragile site protein Fra10Ac1 [Helianthus annuus]